MIIKQSSTAKVLPFLLVDSADHITGKTGLSPTVTLSKNGAAFGAAAGAVTETGNGWYKVAGNATDTNTLGSLVLHASATGADAADTVFEVVAFDPDAATNLGLSNLDAAVSTRATPAQVQTELVTYGALKPTVAARTLDVSATGEAGLDWANIGAPTTAQNLSATNIDVDQVVASVTAGVSLTAGERTTLAGVIWNVLTSTLTTASSIGKLLVDNINATISSRAVAGDAMALTSGERTTLAGVIWNVLTSTLTLANSIGKLIVDNLNATVSSRATPAQVATELTTYGALKPTVAARTLDVSATGEAGIDWANIGAPTTTVSLSGTTVGTVTNLTNDPPGGNDTIGPDYFHALYRDYEPERMAWALGGQTGWEYYRPHGDQVYRGRFGTYDETVDSQEAIRDRGDAAWITGAGGDPWATAVPGAYVAGTAGNILGNRLDAAVSSRATPAQVATELTTYGALKPTTAGRTLDVTAGGEAGIDLDNSVGTLAKGTDLTGFNDISAANVQSELVTYGALKPTIAARTLDVSATGEAGVDWANVGSPTTVVGLSGTTIKAVTDPVILTAAYDAAKTAATQASVNAVDAVTDKLDTALELDGAVYRYTVNALENSPSGGGASAAVIADAVWDEALSGHLTAGSAGAALNGAGSAGDPWTTLLPSAYGAGTAGYIVGNNLNATVSSRATPAQVATELITYGALKPTVAGRTLDVAVGGEAGVDLDNTVGTLAKGTELTGFNDLSAANVQTELVTYGALKPTTVGRTLDVSATGEAGVDWANVGTPGATQNLSATTIATVTNGVSLTSGERTTLVAAIWNVLTSVLTTVGSIGKLLVDNVNATISSRATQTSVDTLATYVDTEVGAIKVATDKLNTAMEPDAAVYRFTTNALEQAPTGGGGSDPWLTLVPGSYGAGTAGNILGNRLDVAVSSRMAAASYVAPDNAGIAAIQVKTNNLPADPADASDIAASFAAVNGKLDAIDDYVDTEISAIKVKTDALPANPASVGDIPTAIQNADALLKRDMSAVTGEASRSPLNAMRLLRNKWSAVETPNTLVVKKEDDATTAWTAPLTTDSAAAPITGMDPA